MAEAPAESFPRRSALTRRFTLGAPRTFEVSADGMRVAFLRSAHGRDPVNRLWVLDIASGEERVVALPGDVAGDADLPAAEKARRERAREQARGVVAYATDPAVSVAAFALGGRCWKADLVGGGVVEVASVGPAFDPRPDPSGSRVAYVSGRALCVDDRVVASDEDPDISWGMAEFIAAEEMGRSRGFWWSPDGTRLAAARVDVGPVPTWHIGDPADPARAPQVVRYPAAGEANAVVSLHVLDVGGAGGAGAAPIAIDWDHEAFPYLARVIWGANGPLTLLVQSRDQTVTQVLAADPASGATRLLREDREQPWIDLVAGLPAWTPDSRLVSAGANGDARCLLIDGEPATPPHLHVRRLVDAGAEIVFTASPDGAPLDTHLYRLPDEALTHSPGVHDGAAGGGTVVVMSATIDAEGTTVEVRRDGRVAASIGSEAERPAMSVTVQMHRAPPRDVRTAVVLPHGWDGSDPLPVLLDPYGGPHAQRVVNARGAFLASQWFADQGFAVVVADGRGTPGRGLAFERAVHLDLAGPVLDDQVAALDEAARRYPLDLQRVAIRGWSFGGYLAALAVLRRPDVFAAAIAGAPVTDWRLYDTHYTERYLGQPSEQPEAYARTSLLTMAAGLTRPLLLVHGLADDNVVAAHTLQLSRALLEAGRPHNVLPLSGVTHMTPQEVVAENLLHLQISFLHDALGR